MMDEPVEVQCKDQSLVCLRQQERDSRHKIDSNCNLSFPLQNLDASTYELSDIEVLQVWLIKNATIIFICY